MAFLAFILFLVLVFIGLAEDITFQRILRAYHFFRLLISTGLITFLGWKALLLLYPNYNDLTNGFTYNGHAYIAAFVFLTLR
jgi:hypothetical protein